MPERIYPARVPGKKAKRMVGKGKDTVILHAGERGASSRTICCRTRGSDSCSAEATAGFASPNPRQNAGSPSHATRFGSSQHTIGLKRTMHHINPGPCFGRPPCLQCCRYTV